MITTHVLDIARGGPAVGVTVILELRQASEWTPVGRGSTDEKGRVMTFIDGPISPGAYRLTFDVAAYQRDMGLNVNFFPEVRICVFCRNASQQCNGGKSGRTVRNWHSYWQLCPALVFSWTGVD